MSTLHTVNRSPFSHSALASCLALCAPGDTLLLLEDGVYAALAGATPAQQLANVAARGVEVLAMTGDLAARGLETRLAPGIRCIDYPEFVAQSCRHQRIQSWY